MGAYEALAASYDRLTNDVNYGAIVAFYEEILAPALRPQEHRRMRELHAQYPHYGFDRHKGYPSAAHRAALLKHGPCPQHRRSFAPVRTALSKLGTTPNR